MTNVTADPNIERVAFPTLILATNKHADCVVEFEMPNSNPEYDLLHAVVSLDMLLKGGSLTMNYIFEDAIFKMKQNPADLRQVLLHHDAVLKAYTNHQLDNNKV